ncbi:large subunit terminase [Alcaligenes phage vB_Af_QDWS595]|uniref:Large subunit terminase n=1 Tax=Alcaligenes phage vB_Af_QDWS595 TaxID=2877946 RepID=A0AAE8Y1N3_9CAUD|nr:large subunit terminase [Alcaligenes phage vB_Af_QDWS595]UCR75492.1 large subunit terminase [Alcaligenes phage vB_Af_QDWS595]
MNVLEKKKTLDDFLNEVDYSWLNSKEYTPSVFALTFMNFIKLVNLDSPESNKTPPVHLKMLDRVATNNPYVANLCFRGAAKTTLFMEYFSMFLAVYRFLPGFGEVPCMIYVSDSMENGVASARKNIEFRYNNSPFLQYWLPKAKFTDKYIEFTNRDGKPFGIKMFGAKTGLRGTKIFGKRPPLAVLDDLVSDDDARSETAMNSIKDTLYKGVNHALDPERRKVILNGTPFNTEDILIEAVESGAWEVNVWPVCERFPCTKEEFVGAWEDRFTFEYVQSQYEMAVKTHKLGAFYQELMLRISSADERIVQDEEIRWYSRKHLLDKIGHFNIYITTDFATSSKKLADYSVISVWAYNSNGDWFWIDGICERQGMDKNIDSLFSFVQQYQPQKVGIEVSGQQGGFVPLIQREMLNRNIWFNFASNQSSGQPGIRPDADKFTRFGLVTPLFKSGKIYFPSELKESVVMGHFIGQIRLVTKSGIKGKDDAIDTISMLAYMEPWKPSGNVYAQQNPDSLWDDAPVESVSSLSSYIV